MARLGTWGLAGSAGAHERGSVPGVATEAVGNDRGGEQQLCHGGLIRGGGGGGVDHKTCVTLVSIAKSKRTAEAVYSLADWLSCAPRDNRHTENRSLEPDALEKKLVLSSLKLDYDALGSEAVFPQ